MLVLTTHWKIVTWGGAPVPLIKKNKNKKLQPRMSVGPLHFPGTDMEILGLTRT